MHGLSPLKLLFSFQILFIWMYIDVTIEEL